jgi:hypothetical protein
VPGVPPVRALEDPGPSEGGRVEAFPGAGVHHVGIKKGKGRSPNGN